MVKSTVPEIFLKSVDLDFQSLRTPPEKPFKGRDIGETFTRSVRLGKRTMQSSRQAARLLARRGQAALAVGRSAAATSAILKRRATARIATEARAISSVAKPRSDAASTRAKSSMAMSLPSDEDYAFAPFSQVCRAVFAWRRGACERPGSLACLRFPCFARRA